jgi:hypothetical protein
MDSYQYNQNTNIEMVPRSSEDGVDSYSNTTTPGSNPQNYIPQEYNNPGLQQNYIPQGYNNTGLQQNYIPQDPNNPDFNPQNTPYNYNQPQQMNPAQPTTSKSPICPKCAIIVMSIIQLSFVIIEIIVLSCKGLMGMVTIHIDEALLVGVSILFFLSYFDKFNINPVIRTLIFIVVFFIGIVLRVFSFSDECFGTLFALMFVRMIALFPSIPFSVLTGSDNPNSSIQFSSVQGHHIGGGRGRGGGR